MVAVILLSFLTHAHVGTHHIAFSSETAIMRTLTVVAISLPIWWAKISSMLVRDERYPVCGPADPNNRPSSRNTAPVPDPYCSSRWQQSFHRSVSAGR
jgi:hypothetical protein